MSEQRVFIDETSKVKKKQTETVLLEKVLKKNQKKGRIRKLLQKKELLRNYFEWSFAQEAACNQTVQYEVKALSDGHDYISCTLVSQLDNNCSSLIPQQESKDKCNELLLHNNANLQEDNTSTTCSNNSTEVHHSCLNEGHGGMNEEDHYKGMILVSNYFNLRLDVEDFVISYFGRVMDVDTNTATYPSSTTKPIIIAS
ncbi:hypothetical protein ABK040_003295 [Willaertia magna]